MERVAGSGTVDVVSYVAETESVKPDPFGFVTSARIAVIVPGTLF
jgi:hypothetical protein